MIFITCIDELIILVQQLHRATKGVLIDLGRPIASCIHVIGIADIVCIIVSKIVVSIWIDLVEGHLKH